MNYYTSYDSILKRYDNNYGKLSYKATNKSEHDIWSLSLRRKLNEILGMKYLKPVALTCQLLDSVILKTHVREKYILQTEDNVWMPFYKLTPISKDKKFTPIIALHGHGAYGKEGVAGTVSEGCESVLKYNTDYGVSLVEKGYVVFCPDARGSGERREYLNQGESKDKRLESSCNSLNFTLISLGLSLTSVLVWDLMRLIDYITSLKDCNTSELSIIGFSGGGNTCLWLAALDERVKKTVVSGYYHSYRGSILRTNQCGCNFVPNLYRYADIGDLGALIAPRKLLIESGDRDPLNGEDGIEDVIGQVEITKKAYNTLGVTQNIIHRIYSGGHKYYGEHVLSFLEAESLNL